MSSLLYITFTTQEPELLIGLLSAFPSEGFEERDDTVVMYIVAEDWQTLEEEIRAMAAPVAAIVSVQTLPEQNWNAEWESSFLPVTIDDFCAVRASFHQPIDTCTYELIIDPKMAFGTAHHETTELMIRGMRDLEMHGKRVLDLGCGTGILAILAMQMGAAHATAIDNDPEAVANAIENAAVNHVQMHCLEGPLETVTGAQFDIILANIDRNALMYIIPQIPAYLLPGGQIMLSGILHSDSALIEEVIARTQLQMIKKEALGEWVRVEGIKG